MQDEKNRQEEAVRSEEKAVSERDDQRLDRLKLRTELRAGVGGVGGNGTWYPQKPPKSRADPALHARGRPTDLTEQESP